MALSKDPDDPGADIEEVKDVKMDPEHHVNRPEQPDFDPTEREPYDHPTQGVVAPNAEVPRPAGRS